MLVDCFFFGGAFGRQDYMKGIRNNVVNPTFFVPAFSSNTWSVVSQRFLFYGNVLDQCVSTMFGLMMIPGMVHVAMVLWSGMYYVLLFLRTMCIKDGQNILRFSKSGTT